MPAKPSRLRPKPSSRNPIQLQQRLAMLAGGFPPIPCEGKSGMLPDWSNVDITVKRIKDWDGYGPKGSKLKGTGIRLAGTILVVDLDIKNAELMNKVLDRLEQDPVFAEWIWGALWRDSERVSVALFGQVSEPIGSRPYRQYGRRLPDGTITERAHAEIHGGKSKRYFAASGPHSEAPRQYRWKGDAPWDVPLSSLPVLPVEEVGRLLDTIEAVLAENLELIVERKVAGNRYDLEPDMVFVTKDVLEMTCAELEETLEPGTAAGVYGVLKSEWEESDSKTRHHAFVRDQGKNAGRLTIMDHNSDIEFYWPDEKPFEVDDEALAAALRPLSEAQAKGEEPLPDSPAGLRHDDLIGHAPTGKFIYRPTGDLWPAITVDKSLGKIMIKQDGEEFLIPSSTLLMKINRVEQMSWLPGRPEIVDDAVMLAGGLTRKEGARIYNLFRPAPVLPGKVVKAKRWVDHVFMVFPQDAEHIIRYLAHTVQFPGKKINHALLLGGAPGVGKDTCVAPVRAAVGAWNFAELRPPELADRFNGWQRAVVLRVNEMHDLGGESMFSLYERMKSIAAAPPEVLRVNEKFVGEYYIPNVVKAIMTTNHKESGVYLPADDRRTYVAWSPLSAADAPGEDYFRSMYAWFAREGDGHVAAYLREMDLSGFDAGAPPRKTDAFWSIVNANRSPTDSMIDDIILGMTEKDKQAPELLTVIGMKQYAAKHGMREAFTWLNEPKYRRHIPATLERAGYVEAPNMDAADRRWTVQKSKQTVYRRNDVPYNVAVELIARLDEKSMKSTEPEK